MNPSPATNFPGVGCTYTGVTPEPASTGAAYVVISHGENSAGAYGNAGVLQEASGTAPGAAELQNASNLSLQAYYVDDFYQASPTYFDDFVLRPSILTVATKAQLGPRAH